MAKITSLSIQEHNKNKCNLYLDGEFFAGVSLETVMKFRLKVGIEIDQKELADLVFDSEKVLALEKSIAYTSKNLKAKKQVVSYLEKKGYSYEVVKYCIDKLCEYNLINDEEYAKRYIESTAKKQGKRLTEYKLMMKGLKKENISVVYDDLDLPSKEHAKELAEKHLKNKERNKENLAKTYRYLIGKGFSFEEANYAVSSLGECD